MAGETLFPTAIDDDTTLPEVADDVTDVLAVHQNNKNEAIKALEAKVGITDSADTDSHDYKIRIIADNYITLASNFGDHTDASNPHLDSASTSELNGVDTDLQTHKNTANPHSGSASTGALSAHTDDAGLHHHDHTHASSGAQGGNIGVSSIVVNEVPGGLVNGSNTAYTTASAFTTGSLRVMLNGLTLKPGVGNDYTEGTQGFTMLYAPETGDQLLVEYNTQPSVFATGSASFITDETVNETANGVITVFTVDFPFVANSTQVYLDGVRQKRVTDYTETPGTGTITFVTAPLTGSLITVDYQHATSQAGNADLLDGQHGAYYAKQSNMDVIEGAWTPYTPVLTNFAIGNGTMVGRYRKVGKTVDVVVSIVFGSSSTYGSGGEFNIGLPFPIASTGVTYVGSAYALDAGIAHKAGVVRTFGSQGTNIFKSAESGVGWNNTVPHTWVTPDSIQIQLTYECT